MTDSNPSPDQAAPEPAVERPRGVRRLLQARVPALAVLPVLVICLVLAVALPLGWTLLNGRAGGDERAAAATPAFAVQPSPASPVAVASPTPADRPQPSQPMATVAPALQAANAPGADLLEARAAIEAGKAQRSRPQLERGLELLARAEAAGGGPSAESERLRSQAWYAMDALAGAMYLDETTMTRWRLVDADGAALRYPIDVTAGDEGLYVIDSGTLYRADLAAIQPGGGTLTMTAVLTPAMRVDGYPVKEIVAVDAANAEDAVFVLDKSNDVYRYQPSTAQWSLELPLMQGYENPAPLNINLATYASRLYLLDPARNQIWRHPAGDAGLEYLPSRLPWLVQPGEPDVTGGLDLAIDGQVYVLLRDGTIVAHNPGVAQRYDLSVADGLSHVPGLESLPAQPIALFAQVDGAPIYVVDPGRRRVVALDRATGALLRQFVAPGVLDFAYLHGVVELDSQLVALAGANLYGIDLAQGITATLPLSGQLPALVATPTADRATVQPAMLAPNDPLLPSAIASYGFAMPLSGALLSDRSSAYPGSRRAYRYGVHEGLDMYGPDSGVQLRVGTPVYAAGAGQVVRADVDYRSPSIEELNALLDEANRQHITSPETLDVLGGRQVWIDHGGGLMTTYEHLNAIADGLAVGQAVQAGQLIGEVGVSGTPDGAAGITNLVHLHFEFQVNGQPPYYVGQWLSIAETRRAYERILGVGVLPLRSIE